MVARGLATVPGPPLYVALSDKRSVDATNYIGMAVNCNNIVMSSHEWSNNWEQFKSPLLVGMPVHIALLPSQKD